MLPNLWGFLIIIIYTAHNTHIYNCVCVSHKMGIYMCIHVLTCTYMNYTDCTIIVHVGMTTSVDMLVVCLLKVHCMYIHVHVILLHD